MSQAREIAAAVQRTVAGPGARVLRLYDAGPPDGLPMLVCHGTPGDGQLYQSWAHHARQRGVRLIGYDRPGYGGSTPHPGRRVADAAADVAAIADALDIDRFAVWGASGGGPHALACAALLPERVAAVAAVASVAPFNAVGLNWFAGMGQDNWIEFGAALQGRDVLQPFTEAGAKQMLQAGPQDLVEVLRSLVSPVDAAALDTDLADYLAGCMPEIFAQGVVGWIDDDLAFVAAYGFEPAEITVPVSVWHGRHDRFVSVAHGEWLARTIPGAEARISDQDGHLSLTAYRIPEVQQWLASRF